MSAGSSEHRGVRRWRAWVAERHRAAMVRVLPSPVMGRSAVIIASLAGALSAYRQLTSAGASRIISSSSAGMAMDVAWSSCLLLAAAMIIGSLFFDPVDGAKVEIIGITLLVVPVIVYVVSALNLSGYDTAGFVINWLTGAIISLTGRAVLLALAVRRVSKAAP